MASRYLCLVLLFSAAGAAAQQTALIDGESFRDPTRPPRAIAVQVQDTAQVSANQDFVVTFISSGSENSTAVINGTLVPLGGTIEGAVVRAIGTDSVTLEVNGQLVEINAFRAGFRSSAN